MINKETLIRTLSYAAYFVFAFLLFLLFLFPFERIKARLETEVHDRTPFELSVARISPRFFNYYVLTDVVLSDKQGKVLFEAPAVKTNLSLLDLIRGILGLSLKAKTYGGSVFIKMQQSKGRQYLMIDADGLDIASSTYLKNAGFNLSGKIGGNFEMTGDSGKGRISVKNLSSRKLTLKGFPIPDLDFETGWLDLDVKGDRLLIKKLELSGKELTIRVTGDMVMRDQGLINLAIRLKPSERLAHEQASFVSLLRNRDAEGFYHIIIGGLVSSPMPQF